MQAHLYWYILGECIPPIITSGCYCLGCYGSSNVCRILFEEKSRNNWTILVEFSQEVPPQFRQLEISDSTINQLSIGYGQNWDAWRRKSPADFLGVHALLPHGGILIDPFIRSNDGYHFAIAEPAAAVTWISLVVREEHVVAPASCIPTLRKMGAISVLGPRLVNALLVLRTGFSPQIRHKFMRWACL